MNTAIEVEYWVVTEDGRLTDPGSLTNVAEYVDPEFVEPILEIKTSPCETMTELREELYDRLRTVVHAVRRDGKHLVPLGTPIHATPDELPYRESDRTELQRRIVGPPFGDARHCAGTHVHFERQGGDATVSQLNALTALDPAFALANTSSYYRGERILECARPYLYRKCCYAGFPEQGQLLPYVESVDEWEASLEAAFEDFREIARGRGIDVATFDGEFDPHTAVWSPIKLREAYPTVEWRSPDSLLPSRALELTADVRAVVERAVEDGTEVGASDDAWTGTVTDGPVALPPFETVERTVDAAMRDGLADPTVSSYLTQFGFEPDRYEDESMPTTGALESTARDRAPVSQRNARKLRLEAAARLEADLANKGRPTPAERARSRQRSIVSK